MTKEDLDEALTEVKKDVAETKKDVAQIKNTLKFNDIKFVLTGLAGPLPMTDLGPLVHTGL